MSSQDPSPLKVQLNLTASPSELLEGITALAELGLLSEIQVRQLCQQYLSCRLPEPVVEKRRVLPPPPPVPPPLVVPLPPPPPPKAPLVPRILQSFVEELSIRWLLFLGVFMVVVSSGVLAASQWDRFPAFVQYTVLWAYTLIFAFVSRWAKQQENLALTAQTLRMVALLLVPLNFWAMDSFGLWQSLLGWVTIAFGAFSLSILSWWFYRSSTPVADSLPTRQKFKRYCPLLLWFWLSYLHWGWGWLPFPLIAAYQGTIGAAGHLVATLRQSDRRSNPFHTAISLYALVILVGRAVFFAHIPVAQLGLAIGLCGWLFTFKIQRSIAPETTQTPDGTDAAATGNVASPQRSPLGILSHWEERFGVMLMVVGWLVCVQAQPAQALAVSGLAATWFGDRLWRGWRRIDLAALYLLGLQALFLIGRVIPPGIRSSAIATGTQLVQAQAVPGTLLSLTWFPYLLVMVGTNEWLERRQKPQLARFGDKFALGFGTFLMAIGMFNPAIRALNLVLSALTLWAVSHRRYRDSGSLVYLTHFIGLLSIAAIVDWGFPQALPQQWAMVLLGVMVAQWGFVALIPAPAIARGTFQTGVNPLKPRPSQPAATVDTSAPISQGQRLQMWRQSALLFGFALAAISYVLFFLPIYLDGVEYSPGGLAWSVAPAMLTLMAWGNLVEGRNIAGWLSVFGLGLLQILTFGWTSVSLLSLGIAAIAMLVNTRILRQTTAAAITLGYGLCFAGMVLREGVLGFPPLSLDGWLLFGAISCAGLWLLSSILFRQGVGLARLYGDAAEGWATALCSLGFPILTVRSVLMFWGYVEPSISVAIAILLVSGATLVRCWSSPSNWGIYCLGWGLELLTVEIIGFSEISRTDLAIANIAWGLLTQLLGDGWRRHTRKALPSGWHVVPLVYGAFAALLRVNIVESWTGLTTLALALIALGVGRRQPGLKPLVYVGFLASAAAAYELLWYQTGWMLIGDRLVAFAAVGTTFVYAYRILAPWLSGYLGLSLEELKIPAHWHWAMGSAALMAAGLYPIGEQWQLGLATGLFLTRYAAMQARHRNRSGDIWVYLGLLEAALLSLWAIDYFQVGDLLRPWAVAIAAVIAYFLFILPWENWGWRSQPWKNSALMIPMATIASEIFWVVKSANPTSLAIGAIFYIFLAKLEGRIRLTYFGGFFLILSIGQQFERLQLQHPLWYVSPILIFILYILQVEPTLNRGDRRSVRHLCQLLVSGLLELVALTTASWWVSGIYALVFIFGGIAGKVRAFLYVGTIAFLANASNQMVLLSQTHSFVKWLVGLAIGLVLIWIAASFETRREQIKNAFKYWMVELQNWQ